jgi:hypothetical protein
LNSTIPSALNSIEFEIIINKTTFHLNFFGIKISNETTFLDLLKNISFQKFPPIAIFIFDRNQSNLNFPICFNIGNVKKYILSSIYYSNLDMIINSSGKYYLLNNDIGSKELDLSQQNDTTVFSPYISVYRLGKNNNNILN